MGLPGRQRHYPQGNLNIGLTGIGITLLGQLDAIGIDLIAGHQLYTRLIDAGIGDSRFIRCPPVTCHTVHLFLSHKLGHGVLDGPATILGQRRELMVFQLENIEVLFGYKGDKIALGRQFGICSKGIPSGQQSHLASARLK